MAPRLYPQATLLCLQEQGEELKGPQPRGGPKEVTQRRPWVTSALPRPTEGFAGGSVVKNPPAMQETEETHVRSLGWEDPLEEGIASHSSILAWKIPRTEEPGGLQSTELQES